jgi:MFS family permease
MTMLFFVATFGMNFQVTTALMSRGVFHTGAAAFGLASTAYAAGALGGALLAARRRRPSARLQVAVALAFGILETASGLMPAYWAFLLLLLPTGLSVVLYTTAANSATQLGTDPQMRGRVMGVYMLVFLGGAPIGSPLIGWIAEQFGPRMSLISGGWSRPSRPSWPGSCCLAPPGQACGRGCGPWPRTAAASAAAAAQPRSRPASRRLSGCRAAEASAGAGRDCYQ